MLMRVISSLMLSCAAVLPAQGSEYEKLVAEHARAAGKDGADAALAEFLPQFAAAAEQRAGKPAAVPFLIWIVRQGARDTQVGPALDALAESHAASLDLGPVLDITPNLATHLGDAPCVTLLDRVLAAGSPPELQAKALLARATIVTMQTGAVDDSTLQLAAKAVADARKLTKDPAVSAALERTNVVPRGLKVGDVAPEVAGFDLDGVPFRLSDYRGKVVVLDFWGDW